MKGFLVTCPLPCRGIPGCIVCRRFGGAGLFRDVFAKHLCRLGHLKPPTSAQHRKSVHWPGTSFVFKHLFFFVLRHPCHEPAIAWNSPAITTQILMFFKILTTHGACHALWHRILVSGVIACEGRGPTFVSVQCEFWQESIIGGLAPYPSV